MDALDARAGIQQFDGGAGDSKNANPITAVLKASSFASEPSSDGLHGALTTQKRLDLVVWYLRAVHSHCYYTMTGVWCAWECKRRPKSAEQGATARSGEKADTTSTSTSVGATAVQNDVGDGSHEGEEAHSDNIASTKHDGGGETQDSELSAAAQPDALALATAKSSAPGKPVKQRSAGRKPFNRRVWDLPVRWADAADRKVKLLLETKNAAAAAKEAEYLAECVVQTPQWANVRNMHNLLDCFLHKTKIGRLACDRYETRAEAAIDKFIEANTKKEREGVYRCLLPPLKRFKGPEYIEKHIRTKHGPALQELRATVSKAMSFERFMADDVTRDLLEPEEELGKGKGKGKGKDKGKKGKAYG
eukprot:SAG22_NODE_4776_length_1166_cov_1.250234_1_plen_361_part_01